MCRNCSRFCAHKKKKIRCGYYYYFFVILWETSPDVKAGFGWRRSSSLLFETVGSIAKTEKRWDTRRNCESSVTREFQRVLYKRCRNVVFHSHWQFVSICKFANHVLVSSPLMSQTLRLYNWTRQRLLFCCSLFRSSFFFLVSPLLIRFNCRDCAPQCLVP